MQQVMGVRWANEAYILQLDVACLGGMFGVAYLVSTWFCVNNQNRNVTASVTMLSIEKNVDIMGGSPREA